MLRMKVFGVLVRERSIREWRRCLPPVRFIVSHPKNQLYPRHQ